MFKKLLFVVALVAVGAGSYGVARAYFSSKAPAVGTATFQAGSIDINIARHDGGSLPLSIINWMPGQTQEVVFDVNNTSTVPVTLTGLVNGSWENGMGDQLVHVIQADYWDGSWHALATPGNGTFTYADFATPGVLKQVPAGDKAIVRMIALFEPTAGNEYQGKTYTAKLQVTAHQIEE